MSLLRQLMRGLRGLSNRAAVDRDISDEVNHYLETSTAEWQARGLTAKDAARQARLELGTATAVREQIGDFGWESHVHSAFTDLRYALRRLRKSAAFSAMCMLTLALGIGGSTAIFSIVNPVLFASLPYPEARRIMMIWVSQNGERGDVAFGTYREIKQRTRSFESLAVTKPAQITITGAGEPERIDGQYVSADYFRVLGSGPAIGRTFEETDDRPGAPVAAIISDGLWKRSFRADRSIVGRQTVLEDIPITIIGVMPANFEDVLSPTAQIWMPLRYDPSLPPNGREWGHHLQMVGRLKQGVEAEVGTQELAAMASAPLDLFPRPEFASLRNGFVAGRLQDELTRQIRPAMLAILGAVALLLGIASMNVVNLLLARSAKRRSELALQAALGASRMRLARPVVTECLLLTMGGGALGIFLANLALTVVAPLASAELPHMQEIQMDRTVLAFSLGLSLAVGLGVALVTMLFSTKADVRAAIQERSARIAGGNHFLRPALVVVQVAFTFLLLVGAGLVLRSLERLFDVPPGFDGNKVLTMQIQTSGMRYRDQDATHRFFDDALTEVRALPGVTTAGLTNQLPLSGNEDVWGVHFEFVPVEAARERRDAYRYAVSPGYFEAMGIPLRSGRLLDGHDLAGAPLAAVINESFARRRLPGLNPIGQRVHIGTNEGPWYTVVGVVADVKQTSLALTRSDGIYVPAAQWRFADGARWLAIRTTGDPTALTAAVRKAIWSIDKDQPILHIAAMDQRLNASEAQRRLVLILLEAFAAVALFLAAIGTYSLLQDGVLERTREIGIRGALGADRASVVAMVLGQGVRLVGIGLILGIGSAVIASQALSSLLFGVSQLDPLTYAGVALLLTLVSALASSLPAWRASRVDPSIALRAE